jgi:hypothetical protein
VIVFPASPCDPVPLAAPGLPASRRLGGPGDDDDDDDETPIGDPPDEDEDGDWEDEDDDDEEPLQAYCAAASQRRQCRGTIAHHRFIVRRCVGIGRVARRRIRYLLPDL